MNLNEFLNEWREAAYKSILDDVEVVKGHIENAITLFMESTTSEAETKHGVSGL